MQVAWCNRIFTKLYYHHYNTSLFPSRYIFMNFIVYFIMNLIKCQSALKYAPKQIFGAIWNMQLTYTVNGSFQQMTHLSYEFVF